MMENDGHPLGQPSGPLVWKIDHLGGGEEVRWIVRYTPDVIGELQHALRIVGASTFDVSPANDYVEVRLPVREVPKLSIGQSADAQRIMVGQELRYALTVYSESPFALDDVVVEDAFPHGAEVVSASASQGQVEILSDRVLFHLGRLDAAQFVSAELVIKPTHAGAAVNRLEIVAPDPVALGSDSRAGAEVLVMASPPLKLRRQAQGLVIDWPAAGEGYQVEYSDSLTDPDWRPYPGVPEMASGGEEWQVFLAHAPQGRFYRLVRSPAP
jgi:uncharacterized repeat protein (TIGR01451 family)